MPTAPDFAGSTGVHTVDVFVALAGVVVNLKSRLPSSITLLSLDRVAHTSGFNDKHRMGKMPMPRGTGVPPVRIGFTT